MFLKKTKSIHTISVLFDCYIIFTKYFGGGVSTSVCNLLKKCLLDSADGHLIEHVGINC